MIMKLDSNFIYIAGYAGHGKDTAKNIMFQHYDNLFTEIKETALKGRFLYS